MLPYDLRMIVLRLSGTVLQSINTSFLQPVMEYQIYRPACTLILTCSS